MDVPREELERLLRESKGLHLLPEDKKEAFIQTVLASPESKQEQVFAVLMKAKEQAVEAEEAYQEKVSAALDEYVADVQNLQKTTIKNLRKNAEKKVRVKEEAKMDELLSSLNNL